MKVKIETDANRDEDEVIIKCREISDAVRAIERIAAQACKTTNLLKKSLIL